MKPKIPPREVLEERVARSRRCPRCHTYGPKCLDLKYGTPIDEVHAERIAEARQIIYAGVRG